MADEQNELLIVGTGAMACLFAARLAAAGIRVTMMGSWPEGTEALLQNGVRITDDENTIQSYPVRVVANLDDCVPNRYALVLVKSWQTERAAGLLSRCLAPGGLALTLQNGIGNREKLAQVLGPERVAWGSTTLGATLVGPGLVRTGGDGVITLGIHAETEPLVDLLGHAGFVVDTVADISSTLWGKLVINASINPLTAILNIPNGELLSISSARKAMGMVAREAAAVAVAKGVRLPYPDPVVAAEAIARRTARNLSSMLQDVRRGAPTEIDVIVGPIIKAGDQTGMPTPVNRTMQLLVRSLVTSRS